MQELCSNKNLSPPKLGRNVHHDPNIELWMLWMPVQSLVRLQRSGQDGGQSDPSVDP